MLNIRRISKKFGLEILEETIDKEEIDISEISGISSIAWRDQKHFAVTTTTDFDISKHLNKIDLVIVCGVEKMTDEIRKKYISYKKPTLYTKFSKREMGAILDSYLLRKQQKPVRVHGTLLSIFGEGVLVIGKSGIGKSELALDLVNRKHLFIGDDAIDIISLAGVPIGKAPRSSREFIEVRGVGIINIKGMFGIQTLLNSNSIDLVVELIKLDDVKSSIERLGKSYSSKELAGVDVPLIQIPLSSGRSISSVVEAAVIAFKQRKLDGYIAIDDLTERLKNS